MNSIGGKTLSPDIIGTATISGAKLFLMKDLKLIYIFQDKLIIKFYFKVTKRNANLPFLSVNFPSVCSEITSQIVCKFLQIIVCYCLAIEAANSPFHRVAHRVSRHPSSKGEK